MIAILRFFIGTTPGRIIGLVLIASIAYGVIYARGYFAAREDQRVDQLERNEDAAKERKAIDRAVPRTDFDKRVDELR